MVTWEHQTYFTYLGLHGKELGQFLSYDPRCTLLQLKVSITTNRQRHKCVPWCLDCLIVSPKSLTFSFINPLRYVRAFLKEIEEIVCREGIAQAVERLSCLKVRRFHTRGQSEDSVAHRQ